MLYKRRCDTIHRMKTQVQLRTLGPDTPYPAATQQQEAAAHALIDHQGPETLFFVTHPALYTAGTSAKMTDRLPLFSEIPVYDTGRGGQLTYHGPGQRVLYPVLDLRERGRDLRAYIDLLQQWIIQTLSIFGIEGVKRDAVGVWVNTPQGPQKIAAIGVRVRQWVTFHGVALNVAPELAHFQGIVPCGITDQGVTSMAALLGAIDPQAVDQVLREKFAEVFNATLV